MPTLLHPILKNSNNFHNFLWRTENKEVLNSPQYQELLELHCEILYYEDEDDEIILDKNDFCFHVYGSIATTLDWILRKYTNKYLYIRKGNHITFHHINEKQLSFIVSIMKEKIYERWLYHNDYELWVKKNLED